MPFFSIIIPVYNASLTLLECLDSVSKQDFTDFEVILVNDGSSDHSQEILENWKKENDNINIILTQQTNKGLGAARNTAIKLASGQFIALLDADDIWYSNKLKRLHYYLKNNPNVEALYHTVMAFGINPPKKRFCYSVSSITNLVKNGSPIVPSAFCYSSKLAHTFPFIEDRGMVEDIPLWATLLHNGYQLNYLNETLTHYREEGGISTNIEDHFTKVFKALEHLVEGDLIHQNTMEQARKRKYYEAARFHQKRKDFIKAEQYYRLSSSKSAKTLSLRFLNFMGVAR